MPRMIRHAPGRVNRGRPHGRCRWCGRCQRLLEGVYLARLYPGETSCDGCGRRARFCDCRPVR